MKKSGKVMRRLVAWLLTAFLLAGEFGGSGLRVYAGDTDEAEVAAEEAAVAAGTEAEEGTEAEVPGTEEDEAVGADPTELWLYINGEKIDVLTNPTNMPPGPNPSGYSYSDGVLKLVGIDIKAGGDNIGIYSKGDLTIEVERECTISLEGDPNKEFYGIKVEGNLTIKGQAGNGLPGSRTKLTIAAGKDAKAGGSGIYATGNLTITAADMRRSFQLESNGSVFAKEAIVDSASCGLRADGSVRIEKAELTAQGAESSSSSIGVFSGTGNIDIVSGELSASGGKVSNNVDRGYTFGIWSMNGNISIGAEASVEASCDNTGTGKEGAPIEGAAISAAEIITISGTVTASCKGNGCAIESYKKNGIVLNGVNIEKPEGGTVSEEDGGCFILDRYGDPALDVEIKPGPKAYWLWIGNTRITDENCGELPLESGSGSYDPATGVLTLNGEIGISDRKQMKTDNGVLITAMGMPVTLSGDAILKNDRGGAFYGINADLNIEGKFDIQSTYEGIQLYQFGNDEAKDGIALKVDGAGSSLKVETTKSHAVNLTGDYADYIQKNGDVELHGARDVTNIWGLSVGGKARIEAGTLIADSMDWAFSAKKGITIVDPLKILDPEEGQVKDGYIADKEGNIAKSTKIGVPLKPLTVSVSAVDRLYEKGNKEVELKVVLTGSPAAGDDVSLDASQAKGLMDDDKAGEGKTVHPMNIKLTGADAQKYEIKYNDVKVNIGKIAWENNNLIYVVKNIPIQVVALGDYIAEGGELGDKLVQDPQSQLDGEVNILPMTKTIEFKVKSSVAMDDINALIMVEVKNATNYEDYKILVKLVGEHEHNESNLTAVAEEPAGCETEGCKEHFVCSKCNKLFVKVGHHYEERTKEELKTAPLGHKWERWQDGEGELAEEYDPTKPCLWVGHCKRCWKEITETIPAGSPVPSKLTEAGIHIYFEDDMLGERVLEDGSKRYETVYTGAAIRPNVVVKNNGKSLVEGRDYILKYSNNVKVSDKKAATVTVKGKGNYNKKTILSFYITQKDISAPDVLEGTAQTVEGKKAGGPILAFNGQLLKNKKDYSFELKDGFYVVTGKGGFTGTRNVTIDKVTAAVARESAMKVTLANGVSKTYNGKSQMLSAEELKVSNARGDSLSYMLDYIVTYSANVNAGTVKLAVVGISDRCCGKASKSFKINPLKSSDITEKLDKESYVYKKSGVKPTVSVKTKLDGVTVTLKEGRDFKVTYTSNKKVGTGKAKVSYIGNYKASESKTLNFTITAAPANVSDVRIIVGDIFFKKANKTYRPKAWVLVNNSLLKSSEVKLTYDDASKKMAAPLNNVSLNAASKGKNYKFENVKTTYDVLPYNDPSKVDVSKAKVVLVQGGKTVKKVPYTGKSIRFTSLAEDAVQLTVKIDKNTTLSAADVKANFDIYYADNTERGRATVILKGKAGSVYVGAIAGSFTITAEPMEKK
ncbi:MAG: hypothetical protein IK115_12750 [Lachnospiraceae bacterium]|nr:hypothetical protein [Lachnospiraceae bacterium]